MQIAGGLRLLAESGFFDDILQPNYSWPGVLHQASKKYAAAINTLCVLLCSLERRNHDHTAHENCV
jgi:hypothetical protein